MSSRLEARDNFSKKTIDLLARRAGGKCSMCACPTWGPNDKPYTATNIGKAAHITAAAEGGPRYDPSMSSEVRSSIKNGLWLCSNCHDNVDRNPLTFTVKHLKTIKEEAESKARKELGVATSLTSPPSSDQLTVIVSGVTIVEVRKLKGQLSAYHTSSPTINELKLLLTSIDFINFNDPSYNDSVAIELVRFLQLFSGYHDNSSLKLEVIRYLSDITSFFPSLDLTDICETLKSLATGHTPRQPVYQSVIAFLKDLSQKTTKNSPNYKIVQETMETVAKQRGRRATGRLQVHESVDFFGEESISKVAKLDSSNEGEEEEDQYIDKMTQLANLSFKEGDEIERQVSLLGFESNIL